MKLKTKKIKHCLLCKNKRIKEIFSLGNLFVSNFVKKKDIKKGLKAPLNLLYCNNCSLIIYQKKSQPHKIKRKHNIKKSKELTISKNQKKSEY